jgi:D-xylose transport system substrate-binding protein
LTSRTSSKRFTAVGLPADSSSSATPAAGEQTELTQAQSAIRRGHGSDHGPDSSGVGASIEAYAKMRGVEVIDYDRLTLGGDRSYYVSFDNSPSAS